MRKSRIPIKYQHMKRDGASAVDVFIEVYKDRDGSAVFHIVSSLFDLDMDSDEIQAISNDAYQIIFRDYIQMKVNGFTAPQIAREARNRGIVGLARFNLISFIFDYEIHETREAIVLGDGVVNSLDEYYSKIANVFEKSFDQIDENDV